MNDAGLQPIGELDTLRRREIEAKTVKADTFTGDLSGTADDAKQFTENKNVKLTGDVTGEASSKAGWEVAATLAASGVTAGTYGEAEDRTLTAGGTFKVPKITVDAKGRITSISEITLTLPAAEDAGGGE